MKKIELRTLLKTPAFYRRLLIGLMTLLILVRPTTSTESSLKQMINLNIWFVVDATGSMVAKDVASGSKRRFEQVQDDMTDIVKNIPGAKYGMIAQDFSTYTASPITTSADAIIAAESYAVPKLSLYTKPTNLSDIINYTAERISAYKERYPDRVNVLVFMSDGEDVSDSSLALPSSLQNLVSASVVFGYGTTSGSIIEKIGGTVDGEYDPLAIIEDEYITYYNRESDIETDSSYRVISKLNESNLKNIASALGANYYHRESGNVPSDAIKTLSSKAKPLPNTDLAQSTTTPREIYYIFALCLLILLLWEGEETLTRIFAERKHA